MARPKASVIGFVDLAVSASNAKNLKNLRKGMGEVSSELLESTNSIPTRHQPSPRCSISFNRWHNKNR